MDTDNLLGAAVGLAALGLVLNVAGKVVKGTNDTLKVAKQKGSNKLDNHKIIW